MAALTAPQKKFFGEEQCKAWVARANEKPGGCSPGDLLCLFCGPKLKTQEAMGKFRHLMGTDLGLRSEGFCALWVVNFPMLEWDDDEERFVAKHHPFTSPWTEDIATMTSLNKKDPRLGNVRANAYDMVINGVEVGGGSIRIHNRELQEKVFEVLGFTKQEAQDQFGFLMSAFEYGAPPHGGLAFGLDRLCTILGGQTTIRNYIAFPKNNQGRDTMIESPSEITDKQLAELSITTTVDSHQEAAPASNPPTQTTDAKAEGSKNASKNASKNTSKDGAKTASKNTSHDASKNASKNASENTSKIGPICLHSTAAMSQVDELYSEIVVLRSGDHQGPHLASGPTTGSGPHSSLGSKAVKYDQPSKGVLPAFPYAAGDLADRDPAAVYWAWFRRGLGVRLRAAAGSSIANDLDTTFLAEPTVPGLLRTCAEVLGKPLSEAEAAHLRLAPVTAPWLREVLQA